MASYIQPLGIEEEHYFSDELYVVREPGQITVYVADFDVEYIGYALMPGESVGVLDGRIVRFFRDQRGMATDITEIFDVVGRFGELADRAIEYRCNVESGYWSPYKGMETVMKRHRVSQSVARDILGLS